ncbi:MAG: glycosyltransferase family 4 protein [Ginsengibacter sp.]
MRILIFYQYFCTPKGSWSTRFYEFASRWVAQGHLVTIVTAPYEKSDIIATRFIEKQSIKGIELIVINTPDSNRNPVMKRALNSISFSIIACWFALTRKSDIVIASSGPITIGIPALVAKFFRRKPLVFEIRDLWPGGGIEMGKIKNRFLIRSAFFFEKLLYRKSNLVVACSEGQKNNIKKRFPDVNCITIPHGGDLELFQHTGTNNLGAPPGKRFSHIGSLGFIHNCKLILQAALIIKNKNRPDISILFIGDGAERKSLEEMKNHYDLTNVEFTGLKPKLELPTWVRSSHATLFTTLNNEIQNTSCPNKIFDSFAAGVPIIQTTTGWIKTLIDEEGCGLNSIPDDPESLANAIIKISDDDALHSQLSANATHVAETLFNRDLLAQKYMAGMQTLLK